MNETEVLIVGSGPIGIELAIALKNRGVAYVQVDAKQIASTISWFAPQTHFFSSPERIAIAGVPLQTLDQTKATREEYLTYLRTVVQQFNLEIQTFQRVENIARGDDGLFEVTSHTGARWRARYVVLAIGDMHRPRLVGVPGEDLPHVSHYFHDPHNYFRRRVLIVGGKNSAVEAAIRCYRVGASVTLSYRGLDLDPDHIKFWLLPEIRSLVRDHRIAFLPGTMVREIRPGETILSDAASNVTAVPADEVLLLTGYEQESRLFEIAGVTLEGERRKPRHDPETMETNVPNLFVAGTAAAGTQLGGVKEFIETAHVHVGRIVAAITKTRPPEGVVRYDMPES